MRSLETPRVGVPEHSDGSWCGRCTRWQVVYIQTGSFSTRVCSGTFGRRTTRSTAKCSLLSSSLQVSSLPVPVHRDGSGSQRERLFTS